MNVSAQITVPHGYNTANATLYLQAVVTNKFVTIGPDTYKKGTDPQGNPIPVLNNPDEGDTAVGLTFNPLLLQYEWTTDITHQLDFKPSLEAWHPFGIPLANPAVLWTSTGAHRTEPVVVSCRVEQNYGGLVCYDMPDLTSYTLRVRVTDSTDNFTDIVEKTMRVHFPVEEWYRDLQEDHPRREWLSPDLWDTTCYAKWLLQRSGSLPEWVSLRDWNYLSGQPGESVFARTMQINRKYSVTGMINWQGGGSIGNDIAKVAFQVNEGVTLGLELEKAYGASSTFNIPEGEVWHFCWGEAHTVKAGDCDIYNESGYAARGRWLLLEWRTEPSGDVHIVWDYWVERDIRR